jgi:hypothetical protein
MSKRVAAHTQLFFRRMPGKCMKKIHAGAYRVHFKLSPRSDPSVFNSFAPKIQWKFAAV